MRHGDKERKKLSDKHKQIDRHRQTEGGRQTHWQTQRDMTEKVRQRQRQT